VPPRAGPEAPPPPPSAPRADARRAPTPAAPACPAPQKKRVGGRIQEEREAKRRAAAAPVAGLKSEKATVVKKAHTKEKSEYAKSAQVFAKIQEQREMEKAGVKVWQKKKADAEGGDAKGKGARLRL